MLYQRRNLATGEDIGEPGPIPRELLGLADESLANLNWADASLGYTGQGLFPFSRKVTALAFKQRLTAAERIAIRAAATSDPVIADFLDLLSSASTVDLDHADTVSGVDYLVSTELLTAERAAELRA
jgi:hypothetical protein